MSGSCRGSGTDTPSDEAVEAAHADLMRVRCREVVVDRRNVPSALTAAYAIDLPRVRAEERVRYDDFIEGLTAKLNAAGVPAMPSWPDAIDWLIERAEARAEERAATLRLREALDGLAHAAREFSTEASYRVAEGTEAEFVAAMEDAETLLAAHFNPEAESHEQ